MTAEQDKEREIVRLRAHIAAEYQATKNDAQGLTGAARHAFVAERMKLIWTYFEQLATLVGSETEAMAYLVELFDKTGNATDDAPPKFLHVGNVFIHVAHIISVDKQQAPVGWRGYFAILIPSSDSQSPADDYPSPVDSHPVHHNMREFAGQQQ